MSSKKCCVCQKVKTFSHFEKRDASRDGFDYICKHCKNIKTKARQKTKKGLISKIYSNQRESSRRSNYPMPTYSNEELREWMFSQPLFHRLYNDWKESNFDKKLSPSVDRLDDYKGYSFNNIQLMTWQENSLKQSEYIKNGKTTKISKAVNQYDLEGNFIKEWYSMAEAGRKTTANRSSICNCCRGIVKESGGYKWEYKTTTIISIE